ncbi:hypothetical protein [Carboxylicivirga sp. M1479]|uniref:hypothetical protein n=1 Tax=Carboxylicivirga sp. M1479 TaxID=2594476 RepID=UPI001178B8BE|nr:hypothetical protein [Carboxylicivirga sp. M1479]TRX66135.1 hypothetical protein FNN09_15145 [Carboxylicivirga sp. M1479]
MKRKGIIALLAVWYLGFCLSCSSDNELLSSKEILSNALTKGVWQTSFKHSLGEGVLDQAGIQLTFSDFNNVSAVAQSCCPGITNSSQGSYALFYKDENRPHPDEELEYYYDEDKQKKLFISLVFATNELLILNKRWKVKSFTSTTVILQANDVVLTLINE